jgi:Tol biopolymer transport system component
VLVRNIVTGETQLASAVSGGTTPGNGFSESASVDAAGDKVAFESTATNLVPGVTDGNGAPDLFVRDLVTGQTTLVDHTPGGGVPLMGADGPEISADGKKVVFVSASADLEGAAPSDNRSHVYEDDLTTGDVTLIDQTAGGVPANGDARGADLDADGERVAFLSNAANLGGGTQESAYVRDLTNPGHPTTTWVSVPQNASPADDSANAVTIDATGAHVAWTESNPSFGFGMNSKSQVFVRMLATGTTILASTGPTGPANSFAFSPSLSDDGSLLAFGSVATNLPGAVPGYGEEYVRNLSAGTTAVAGVRNGSDAPGDLGAFAGSISGNGDCVAFGSNSDDLVAGGYSSVFDHVFLHALNGACPPSALPPRPPVIKKLSLTNKRFALGTKPTAVFAASHKHKRVRHGTTFVITLSVTASTRIVISRKHRTVLTLVRAGAHAGVNLVPFSGRWDHKKKLAAGSYRATVTATNAGGRSKPRSVTFTVIR